MTARPYDVQFMNVTDSAWEYVTSFATAEKAVGRAWALNTYDYVAGTRVVTDVGLVAAFGRTQEQQSQIVDELITGREPQRYVSTADFRRSGYLQEANRQWFHPLGMALELDVEDSDDDRAVLRVWDDRDDPEGIRYDLGPDHEKTVRDNATNVLTQRRRMTASRTYTLGYFVQPVHDITMRGVRDE